MDVRCTAEHTVETQNPQHVVVQALRGKKGLLRNFFGFVRCQQSIL